MVVAKGRIASLRRFKDDVREVASGMECGILLENFQDRKLEIRLKRTNWSRSASLGARRAQRRSLIACEVTQMVVGVLRLTFYIDESHSLKEKSSVLRKIKSRVRHEFNVSIAECDEHDLWQKTQLGICQVGTDQAYIDGALQAVVRFIEDLHLG